MIDWGRLITAEDKFEQGKVRKLEEIAAARWTQETAPFWYEPKGASFDTSERSQVKYIRAYEKGEAQIWKTVDAGWVEMKQADFAGLIGAYEMFVASLFAKEAGLQTLVDEAQSVRDLDKISW